MAFWTDVFLNKVRQDWLKRIVKIQYYAGGVWYDARYPFNGSSKSVSLKANRKTKNYTVEYEVSSSDGNVGEIVVGSKALNGFSMAFTGSAKTVTVKLKIRGGIIA